METCFRKDGSPVSLPGCLEHLRIPCCDEVQAWNDCTISEKAEGRIQSPACLCDYVIEEGIVEYYMLPKSGMKLGRGAFDQSALCVECRVVS